MLRRCLGFGGGGWVGGAGARGLSLEHGVAGLASVCGGAGVTAGRGGSEGRPAVGLARNWLRAAASARLFLKPAAACRRRGRGASFPRSSLYHFRQVRRRAPEVVPLRHPAPVVPRRRQLALAGDGGDHVQPGDCGRVETVLGAAGRELLDLVGGGQAAHQIKYQLDRLRKKGGAGAGRNARAGRRRGAGGQVAGFWWSHEATRLGHCVTD